VITTVWLMVRSRRVASLTVVLLTALVVAVAVAPATYLAYADRALINSEARNAPAAGLSVSASSTVAVAAGDREFESVAPPLFAQPWLTTTFGVDVTINVVNPVLVAPHDSDFRPLIYREDVCGHVTVVAGRCVVAARELMVSEDLATLLKLTVGDPVQMYATAYSPIDGLTRVGSPILGTVVGVINAFQGIGASGSAGIGAVSVGISEALVETALGLVVAIPAVWFYNYLSGRIEYFNVEMDNSSSELVDYFIKKTA
jgi:hypothetical protein